MTKPASTRAAGKIKQTCRKCGFADADQELVAHHERVHCGVAEPRSSDTLEGGEAIKTRDTEQKAFIPTDSAVLQ